MRTLREGAAHDRFLLLNQPRKMFQNALVAWLLLDFAVKQVVVANMEPGQTIALWPGVFHLTYLRNSGAAFSMLQGYYWVFYLAMVFLMGLVVWFWLREKPAQWLPVLGTALVCGGAAGNLIDRLTSGSVVDVFDFRLINFAVFNVADVGITIGCALFLYWFIFQTEYMRKTEPVSEVALSLDPSTDEVPQDAITSDTQDPRPMAGSAVAVLGRVRLRASRSAQDDKKEKTLTPFRMVRKVESALQRWEDELSDENND